MNKLLKTLSDSFNKASITDFENENENSEEIKYTMWENQVDRQFCV